MDLVNTCHDARYWSKVLCCTIMIPLNDLEVKVTDLEIYVKVFVKAFKSLYFLMCLMDLVDTLPDARYWSNKILRCVISFASVACRSRSQTLKFNVKAFG